ncbi:MAG: LPXTG cell wall anchor domain-containing protein, partial [Pseudolysinimonas sp.]
APTDQTTCTAEYTVLAADSGRSAISNTAEASASYASGGSAIPVTSAASTAVVAVDPAVGLALTGSDGWRWGIALAAVALGAGIALLAIARRRRHA